MYERGGESALSVLADGPTRFPGNSRHVSLHRFAIRLPLQPAEAAPYSSAVRGVRGVHRYPFLESSSSGGRTLRDSAQFAHFLHGQDVRRNGARAGTAGTFPLDVAHVAH